ncbi:MAG: hypothetical protein AAGA91_16340 [Pseudomonadota bacterium]
MRSLTVTYPAVTLAALLTFCSSAATASAAEQAILDRLNALEAKQQQLESALAQRDQRIRELEERLQLDAKVLESTPVAPGQASPGAVQTVEVAVVEEMDLDPYYGVLQPNGRGFRIADTPNGTLNFGAWTYVRYLNQKGLDRTYTDSFGREFDIDRRNDVQLNKVNLTFSGWVYDPDFRYVLYTWTSNTSQGESAQVVVAGNLRYRINKALDLGFGIDALPGTRTTSGTFPYWNRVDSRTMADQYFTPSYTSGVWASGMLTDDLRYKFMVGNNLSQLGVNAARLDGELGTFSGRLEWMPTTGEFGLGRGYGDFEMHREVATSFGLSATYSDEDRQSQPGTEDINNSQIRLSDGTLLFSQDAFDTDGDVLSAHYQMVSADAGMKYEGFSLLGEYYWRWVNDFNVQGDVPVDNLFDHGFQVQSGYMIVPKTWQVYGAASKIFGEFGNPWDLALGANWFPTHKRLLRVNGELLYMKDSAIGYSSIPYQVGGDGLVFMSNLEMKF